MDLKVYLPTFNIEGFESKPLDQFLQLLDESTNRQNAFFDESVTGYVVLTNEDTLSPQEQDIYFDTLKKAFISIDLSVHPSKSSIRTQLENFQIRTFNYSYKDCIFNDVLKKDEDDEIEDDPNQEEQEQEQEQEESLQFIAIWKFKLPVSYPKRKINNPEIIISILLTLSNYQSIIQKAKLSEKYSTRSKIMLRENTSTDELTLHQLYKPAENLNLLQGLEPQVKVSQLQTQESPVLLASQVLSDEEMVDLNLIPAAGLGGKSATATSNKRSSVMSAMSMNEAIPATINLNAKILLPVYPVLNMRLKCTKPAGRNDILLTTLEIESSKELSKINMSLSLLEINLEFPNGSIKPLIPPLLQKFPIEINYSDNLNFIYELINNNSSENLTKKPILITLISQPTPKGGHNLDKKIVNSETLESSNKIVTRWNTIVDFSIVAPPTNTALKSQASSQGFRPPSGSIGGGRHFKSNSIISSISGSSSSLNLHNSSSSNKKERDQANNYEQQPQQQQHHSLPASRVVSPVTNSTTFSMGVNSDGNNNELTSDIHQRLKNQTRATSTSLTVNIPRTSKSVLNGLILSFHGTTNVKVGQIFKWKIQAINKAHKILNLSLYIQPKDNNNHSFLTTNITERATPKLGGGYGNAHNKIRSNQIIYPYVNHADSNINLTKVFNQTKLTPSGIICLNNDVRIGPFDHYSVFETEINLIAIEKGIFSLQGVKIIDITSGESFDCGKLLEVVVID